MKHSLETALRDRNGDLVGFTSFGASVRAQLQIKNLGWKYCTSYSIFYTSTEKKLKEKDCARDGRNKQWDGGVSSTKVLHRRRSMNRVARWCTARQWVEARKACCERAAKTATQHVEHSLGEWGNHGASDQNPLRKKIKVLKKLIINILVLYLTK